MWRPRVRLNVSLTVALAATMFSACRPVTQTPSYKYRVTIEDSKPGADPRCTCDQSRARTLVNPDPTNRHYTTTRVQIYVNGVQQDDFQRKDILDPKGQPNDKLFLGCSIATIGQPGACIKTNEFSIVDDSTFRASADFAKVRIASSPFFINDAQSCVALCQAGQACYTYGVEAAPLAVPFLTLLDSSGAKPGTIVAKQKLLSAYNLKPEDDKCNRGDLVITDTDIQNKAADDKGCEVTLNDAKKTSLPSDPQTYFPAQVSAVPADMASLYGIETKASRDKYVTFPAGPTAPAIGWKGENGEELTNLYGGTVRAATVIDGVLYLSNSNGCVSMRLK